MVKLCRLSLMSSAAPVHQGYHAEACHWLQVAMACARDMGLDEAVVQFVLPLATTVNMNGTALYEAVTVIFIAQVSYLLQGCQLPSGAMSLDYPAVHSQPASL